jgi:MerR family transcriptional regulator, light-induced transcriptional regulator
MSSSNDESNTNLGRDMAETFANSDIDTTLASRQISSQVELLRAIESDIIPRLLMAYRDDCEERSVPVLASGSVGELVTLLLGSDSQLATLFMQAQLKRGVPVETLLLELMAPAARVLGEMWESDDCSFVDVTVGLSRMQRMLRLLRPEETAPANGISILLASTPGEQHVFGLRMAEELLGRAGWNVRCVTHTSADELASLVFSESFDMIGFSLGGETLLAELTATISKCRAASANKSVGVLVGGAYVQANPGLAKKVGADFEVSDAKEALQVATDWLQVH